MQNQELTPERCAELVPYATESQARYLLALSAAGGSFRTAARALGCDRNTVRNAFRAAKVSAARRGFAPEHGWNPPAPRTEPVGSLPEKFELERRSELVDLKTGEATAAWNKSRLERGEAEAPPPDFLLNRVSQYTDGQGKLIGQWRGWDKEKAAQWEGMIAAAKDACASLSGVVDVTPGPDFADADTLAVYGLGDPHIGMLSWGPETGEDFDLKIAEEHTTAVVAQLVQAAPSSEIGLLALIGDNFHADDDRQVTPGHGHKLDVDTRAAKVFRVGCRLWKLQIETMLRKHKRVVVNVTRGNHDPLTAFFMREWLCAIFANEPRVTVLDNVAEHQYILFGGCLIGLTHGHKTKPEGLAGVMAADVPEMWAAATAVRHWITGHIHSKTQWDFRGCSLETLRTLAPPDAYAAGAGYRSAMDSVVITMHKRFGITGRQVVNRLRAGIIVAAHERGVKL